MLILAATVLMVACQKKDLAPAADMLVNQPDASLIKGHLEGFDYIIEWPTAPKGYYTMYAVYNDGVQVRDFTVDVDNVNRCIINNIETHTEYEFVFKYCTQPDGFGPISKGTVINYTRPGAAKVRNLRVDQVEEETLVGVLNSVVISWDAVEDADGYHVLVNVFDKKTGALHRTEFDGNLSANETKLVFDAEYNEVWEVTVASYNAKGYALSVSADRLVGKTKNAFLSLYATEEMLMADGDDDEKCAWILLHNMYPEMRYLYMGDVAQNASLLDPLRMCFFIRDVESGYDAVYNMPSVAVDAAPVIGEWVKNGGNLCLWSHAAVYIGTIGRFPADQFAGGPDAVGAGPGGINPDLWKMGATIKTDGGVFVDNVNHPLFRGVRTEKTADGITLVPCKGAGWTEDHNCGWFDRPSWWTGEPNNAQACYEKLKKEFGVTPLGTWDSQAWWVSQLLVWEAGPAETPNPMFEGNSWEGTILCCANGGFEISMKNPDGTEDLTMSVNSEQDQINLLVRNAVDYLMSK